MAKPRSLLTLVALGLLVRTISMICADPAASSCGVIFNMARGGLALDFEVGIGFNPCKAAFTYYSQFKALLRFLKARWVNPTHYTQS